MSDSIAQKYLKIEELNGKISNFFSEFQIGALLKKCNGCKEKGISSAKLLKSKFSSVFMDRSIYMQFVTGSFPEECSKNTFYRFLNSTRTNWLRFTTLLASAVIQKEIQPLTGEDRINAFVIDDSLFGRTGCRKTELASVVFDHCGMRYRKGYRMLTLSWTDGNTLIPVNSCLLASSKEKNIIGPVKAFDGRTVAAKRRRMAQMKGTEAMISLLKTAMTNVISAKYVLFDSWFSNPAQIAELKELDLHTIAMIKKSSRIRYSFNGEALSVKQIYSRNRKRRGRSKYLLSTEVKLESGDQEISARIVCVRNRNNRKDWLAFICTDMELSEEEIIRIYGKRWQIEVFFKAAKSMLRLTGECHSLSYDALTAHVAVVFTRYIFLALEQRRNEDDRTIGELFCMIVDEMADITFAHSLSIILQAMLESVVATFHISKEQMKVFVADFESRLPKYIRDALKLQLKAA